MTEKEKGGTGELTMNNTKCTCSLEGSRFCHICPENPSKRALKITSSSCSSELISDSIINGVKYHVQTEKLGPRKPIIVTHVWKDGEIISTKKNDYRHLAGNPELEGKLRELMESQHLSVINNLKTEKAVQTKHSSVYIEEIKKLIDRNEPRGALKVLQNGLAEHPFNPFLLSYFGCLEAVVNKNYKRGVEICIDALEIMKAEEPLAHDVFVPVFYLNLGKAYLAAGKKKHAFESFVRGLAADPEDQDLLWQVKGLGIRKKPFIPFLSRSNPMNKYIGIFLY